MKRLSDRAAILLCLINDHTSTGEDGRITHYWIPGDDRWGQACPILGGRIHVSGNDAGALRALERRGFTLRQKAPQSAERPGNFSYSITEDGIIHIERCLREMGRLDELRQVVKKHDDVMMGKRFGDTPEEAEYL